MCSIQAVAAGSMLAGSLLQGDAALKRGQAVKREDNLSADMALEAASDAVRKGELEDLQLAMKGSAVEANSIVAASGSGADVNMGGPLQSRLGTRAIVELDRANVRRNAALEAYGLRTRARSMRQEGENAEQEGKNAFVGSFLSGITSAASVFGKQAVDKAPTSAPSSGASTYTYNGGDPN